jgi:hypothetical protein
MNVHTRSRLGTIEGLGERASFIRDNGHVNEIKLSDGQVTYEWPRTQQARILVTP